MLITLSAKRSEISREAGLLWHTWATRARATRNCRPGSYRHLHCRLAHSGRTNYWLNAGTPCDSVTFNHCQFEPRLEDFPSVFPSSPRRRSAHYKFVMKNLVRETSTHKTRVKLSKRFTRATLWCGWRWRVPCLCTLPLFLVNYTATHVTTLPWREGFGEAFLAKRGHLPHVK